MSRVFIIWAITARSSPVISGLIWRSIALISELSGDSKGMFFLVLEQVTLLPVNRRLVQVFNSWYNYL